MFQIYFTFHFLQNRIAWFLFFKHFEIKTLNSSVISTLNAAINEDTFCGQDHAFRHEDLKNVPESTNEDYK